MKILENEPLSKHCWYRIGGVAQYLAIPKTEEDLSAAIEFAKANKLVIHKMGAGSNILIQDAPVEGLVLKLSALNQKKVDFTIDPQTNTVSIELGAGVPVHYLLRLAKEHGWTELDRLCGIPGSMGGVLTMNAGTHLGEIRDLARSVRVLRIQTGEILNIELTSSLFSYRESHFLDSFSIEKNGFIILSLKILSSVGDPNIVTAAIDENLARRKASQPIEYPSCGSVFKNPPGKRAWQVIDSIGFRGKIVGGAQVSEKHPNFIINLGSATADDVLTLIQQIQEKAKIELNIDLIPEVQTFPSNLLGHSYRTIF